MSAGQQRVAKSYQGWQTPPEIVELLHALWPRPEGFFDPCTTSDNPTRATNFATEADPYVAIEEPRDCAWESLRNHETGSWHGVRSLVPIYMNPPWAEMAAWVDRLVTWRPPAWVLCGPATPDRPWWPRVAAWADVVVFTRGRLAFVDPRTGKRRKGAPTGTFFAYRGRDVLRFVELFGPLGTVWYPGHEPGEWRDA